MNATRYATRYVLGLLLAGVAGCGVTDDEALPPYLDDPANVQTPAGALGRYRGALDSLPLTFAHVVRDGNAIVTDELAALPLPFGAATSYTAIDSRQDLSGGAEALYGRLHIWRAEAREARGIMAAYIEGGAPELRGHLYALEGYAELFLADLFCSGIPLSTVDFGGDYTLRAGSTTAEVYQHAKALFDSALTLTGDSLQFRYLAEVGRGRALLALDSLSAAAAAVATVPDVFRYSQTLPHPQDRPWFATWFAMDPTNAVADGSLSVGDREGINGLDYRSSGDPRTLADTLPRAASRDRSGNLIYLPDTLKYPLSSSASATTLTLANGTEARLIEAEAALAAGDGQWLVKLNQLRQTVGLADTTDPGTPDARVNLLFRERAFWLYLTGHRLGDMRRLVRHYGRNPNTVFPTDFYPGGPTRRYGTQVVFPVPASERTYNPKYTGCFDFNA